MRWEARRASTCGTAAGRSVASSTLPFSTASAAGAKKRWPRSRPRRGKPRIKIGVATSGCSPAEVAPHCGALYLTPAAWLAPGRDCPPYRRRQCRSLGALEEKSGFPVQDAVGQPAGGGRDRRPPRALAVHLVKAARLEARRQIGRASCKERV